MATRIPVPNKPKLQDEDYALGQDPNWLANFSQNTGRIGQDANALRGQGDRLGTAANAVQSRATPTTNFGRAQAMGGAQTGAAEWLTNYANGPQGPSAAQAQLQQGANQSMQQSLALARAGSGFGESANGLAQAQRANADTMATTANQAAMLRAQEDQAFRQQQLGAIGTAADIYGGAAAREGDQSRFLTEAELQQRGMNDAQQLGLGAQSIEAQNLGIQGGLAAQGMGLDATQAELEARIAQGNTAANLYGTEAGVFDSRLKRDAQQREARRADRGEAAGFVGKAAGAALSVLSDRRTKKRIRGATTDLDAAYAALEGSK
jgi:hypothetical protein